MINCLWRFFPVDSCEHVLSVALSLKHQHIFHISALHCWKRRLGECKFNFSFCCELDGKIYSAWKVLLKRMEFFLMENLLLLVLSRMDKDLRKLRTANGKNCKTMQFNWISGKENSSLQSVFYLVAFVPHRGQVAWARNQKFTANCCAINCRLRPNPIFMFRFLMNINLIPLERSYHDASSTSTPSTSTMSTRHHEFSFRFIPFFSFNRFTASQVLSHNPSHCPSWTK